MRQSVMMPVFVLRIRTVVTGSVSDKRRLLRRNKGRAADMFPQLTLQSTEALSADSWASVLIKSQSAPSPWSTIMTWDM
jgi:hypothetical protein